jgi:hypothetical protein
MSERPEDDRVDPDALVEEQEDAAAAEAGGIGGRGPDYHEDDPAAIPLDEAGEGESEGFEQAEEALIRNASHEDPSGPPTSETFGDEENVGSEFGEADGVDLDER